jgi:hypothetical protein
MHFLGRYSPLFALVLSYAAATNAKSYESSTQDVSCRCGASDFLTLPHANLSEAEPADKCFAYRLYIQIARLGRFC